MHSRITAGLILGLTLAGVASAAAPRIWVQSGSADFEAGDAVSAAIDADGAIRLAPALDQLAAAPEPRVWAVLQDDEALYVASGEQGRVFRMVADEEPQVVFEAPELGAQALALGPDGHLYVAAGPRGGIYRVPTDHDGSALEPWFDPDTTYVWDLAFDSDGSLWVATGGDGKILVLDRDGNAETVYDSPEPHVTALTFDSDGNLFAGTEGEGLVYRVGPDGDVFVLYDAPLREITDLIVVDDVVWAAAFGGGSPVPAAEGDPVRASRANGAEGSTSGAVYALESDGYARRMWRSDSEGAYALAPTESGIVVGTGGSGRLLAIDGQGRTALLAKTEADQVMGLRATPAGVVVATSNPGRILTMRREYRDAGTYLSAVKDTETISRWGAIRWHAETPEGTSLRLSSRSGNTATPDDTWSDWSAPYATVGAAVTSPPARFLQWRVEMESSRPTISPALLRVEVAYVTRNLAPEIEELTVHPAGVVYRQNSSFEDGLPFAQLPPSVNRALREADPTSAASSTRAFLGRPFFLAGQQTVTWAATDPNDDALAYRLEFRGESESTWKPLAGPLTETVFVLDTRRLPDGTYLVRLTADDEAAHPRGESLRARRVSRAFSVDNTPPEVIDLELEPEGTGVRIRGRARDDRSLIAALQYSLDGGEWRTVLPADGVADSADEPISILLEDPGAGEHVLVVRVVDTALNEGAGKVVFGRGRLP